MKRYAIELTGTNPIIMHSDNVGWSDKMRAWQKSPQNKGKSVAGDDRSPAWTWMGYAYRDAQGQRVVIDVDNLMAMLRDAGKKCPAATGRGSLKAATQSGIVVEGLGWPLLSDGAVIPWAPLAALEGEPDFELHETTAAKHGLRLFVKRARVGTSKHVRVRPVVDNWSAAGTIMVLDDALTLPVLRALFETAGAVIGVGDWRPSSPSSGRYGTFTATVTPA